MLKQISGEFEVKLEPLSQVPELGGDLQTSRFALRKTFHGSLEATSKGEMMAAGRADGMGAYVAIDFVDGTLEGKRGSFLLTHVGTRTAATQALTVAIVPHSGTGELKTIAGNLGIRIENGKHFYNLEYSL